MYLKVSKALTSLNIPVSEMLAVVKKFHFEPVRVEKFPFLRVIFPQTTNIIALEHPNDSIDIIHSILIQVQKKQDDVKSIFF